MEVTEDTLYMYMYMSHACVTWEYPQKVQIKTIISLPIMISYHGSLNQWATLLEIV